MKPLTKEKTIRTISFNISSIDEESRTFMAVASDDTIDRHGTSLRQNGWILDRYLKNPVGLYGHDNYAPPVFKTLEINVDNQGRLMFKSQWPTADVYEFADTIFKLYKGGYMRAFSVGFVPLDAEWDKETETYVITQMELLEISAVTVPSNPNALALAYKEGVINESERKRMIATHTNILKSLTDAKAKAESINNNEDEIVQKELLEAIGGLTETVKGLQTAVVELRDAKVQTDDGVKDNDTVVDRDKQDTAVVEPETEPGDKASDEKEDAGAQDKDRKVTDEEARAIIDATVEKALKEARGIVD